VDYQAEAVRGLALGALLSLFVLAAGLRNVRLTVRAFAPVASAVTLTAAILLLLGVPLSLFHLMALSVVAGIGYDYALFLDRLRTDGAPNGAIVDALILCAMTTIFSYAILSLSQLPILNGIGLTVAIGCLLVLIVTAVYSLSAVREARK
jgi:predicted exporter